MRMNPQLTDELTNLHYFTIGYLKNLLDDRSNNRIFINYDTIEEILMRHSDLEMKFDEYKKKELARMQKL